MTLAKVFIVIHCSNCGQNIPKNTLYCRQCNLQHEGYP